MKFNLYDNLVEATADLSQKGYKESFKFTEENKMMCLANEKSYEPKSMKIVHSHRFEGMTNPADMSIIFAVECDDGTKGMIISSYGTYANEGFEKFMSEVERTPVDVEFPDHHSDPKDVTP